MLTWISYGAILSPNFRIDNMASKLANQRLQRAPSINDDRNISDAAQTKASRGSRSREKTRKRLIDAALQVMSEKGVEGTAINDITEAADVGFGSFYNHFATKAEIATAVFEVHAKELAVITQQIGDRETDVAIGVSYIQRVFMTKATADPVWGWFIVHASNGLPELSKIFEEQGIRHIRQGREAGRFTVSCDRAAMRVILASLLASMRGLLEGELELSDVAETIECLLRMLGVSGEEATLLSKRKLPAYVSKML
jgi:AcrR family transcriptional regulator